MYSYVSIWKGSNLTHQVLQKVLPYRSMQVLPWGRQQRCEGVRVARDADPHCLWCASRKLLKLYMLLLCSAPPDGVHRADAEAWLPESQMLNRQ